jgi:hypothetical protein
MSTHTAISYHIVFSTKNRAPVLRRDRREDLFRYIRVLSTTAEAVFTASTAWRIIFTSSPACIYRQPGGFREGHQARLSILDKGEVSVQEGSHWQEGYGAVRWRSTGNCSSMGIEFDERYML